MTRFINIKFLPMICVSIFTMMAFYPVTAQAEEFTEAQKTELKKMFEEYLLENGENILKSVNEYQAKIMEQDRVEASKKAGEFLKTVKDRKDLPMAGNPKGDITVVEFFDYNCGYCHKALEEIKVLLKDDKNVKVIFIDMPILGPSSVEASKWSLAAHKQGKYFEYHQAIMGHTGPKDETNLEKLAQDVGLDVKKLKKEKDSKEIADLIDTQIKQAQDIGINGTPGFIINNDLYAGYIPAEEMKRVIGEIRKR